MSNIKYELNDKLHAIIINPYLSWEDFLANCDLIKKNNIRNISTSLTFLSDLRNSLNNYKVNINALISYPLADLPLSFINEFISYAKDKGANGIEYSPKFINLSKTNLDTFGLEIERLKSSNLPITIIIDKAKLERDIFIRAVEISLELGITNFQFGDGFGPPITTQDVIEILKLVRNQKVKIVGGIKKLTQVIELFDLGVDFVGTSNFFEIFEEVKN
tara:strand:- start:548 stop:1201 length:654 start_codon:yes stop_codon:yes gene_type:complete